MSKSRRPSTLLRDERGVYMIEYTIILCLVFIGLIGATTALAAPLLRYHDAALLPVQMPLP
jgi:Flp pilus assembly pilin Flp